MNERASAAAIARPFADAAAAWRRGDDQQGLDLLQQGCLLWLAELEAGRLRASAAASSASSLVTPAAGRAPLAGVADAVDAVDALADALEQGDVALAADVLEFRLAPLLRSLDSGGEQAD